jgi:hypothetical protein
VLLGDGIYTEILRRAGHCNEPCNFPNADRQKNTLDWMGTAERGLERLRSLGETVGASRFISMMEGFKIATDGDIPSLQMLRRLITALETSIKCSA